VCSSDLGFMLRLVEDLLDIAKITSGKVLLDLRPLNLVALAKHSIALNNILAFGKQIEIKLCEGDELPDIIADAAKLEQVLNNLLSNAIKFSYPHSTVEVRIARNENCVTIAVKDQGQGIPANELDQLFTPFAKTSVKSTAGERSTGLGLAITRQVVLEHKGKIWVESQVGQGSTFYVSLPIEQPNPVQTSE
jgi:signal transduction histidine kinase